MSGRDLSAENRSRVAALYTDYIRGDMPAVMAALDKNVVWTSDGDGCAPWAGRWLGKAGVAGYFAALATSCEVLTYDIERILADGEWVTLLATIRVRYVGDGLERQYAKVDIMRLVNGRVVEFREFYDTASMVCDLERASAAR